jgi:hypothetical protein
VQDLAPVDLVAANHVLYFWREPEQVLSMIRECLVPGGSIALGYQLRQNMPGGVLGARSPAGSQALAHACSARGSEPAGP